ncbi:MAG TPA: hypothetical protein DCL38_07605 [Lachnospiraceae bacterium]|nr:hypothetical protein [Lachnospiraceae bacterium]
MNLRMIRGLFGEGRRYEEDLRDEEDRDLSDDDDDDEGCSSVVLLILLILGVIVLSAVMFIAGRYLDIGYESVLKPETEERVLMDTAAMGEKFMPDSRAVLQSEEVKKEATARNVYFAGIEDSVLYGEGRIALDNLAENEDFLMRYEVYDTEGGEMVFETGMIESGERVYFDPYSVLEPGVYRLRFTAIPYMEQNGSYLALTNGSNEVTIELK